MRLLRVPGVFEPHSDSLMLADQLRRESLAAGAKVLDLCTGSGLLAILAALRGAGRVVAVDISRRAVRATRFNAKLNGVTVHARRGDLFRPVEGEQFDLIVANPPYVPSVDGELPKRGASRAWEAGPDGRAFVDRICVQAAPHLTERGVLLLVHSSICSEQATVEALVGQSFDVRVLARSRGPLGRRMRERAPTLRARGLLSDRDSEDLVVVRGQLR
jgi:release factor glutamine methyltransferase